MMLVGYGTNVAHPIVGDNVPVPRWYCSRQDICACGKKIVSTTRVGKALELTHILLLPRKMVLSPMDVTGAVLPRIRSVSL
jgi:hypothetical protein